MAGADYLNIDISMLQRNQSFLPEIYEQCSEKEGGRLRLSKGGVVTKNDPDFDGIAGARIFRQEDFISHLEITKAGI